MNKRTSAVAFLPGASGCAPDLTIFKAGPEDKTRFQAVRYPRWERYVGGLSNENLIADLANQIATTVPDGPIRIVGMSIGGHFGYAAALRLQAAGRKVAGFCAIDSFMIESEAPSDGWKGRALGEALELIRQRRAGAFAEFTRSKFWRALLRLAGNRLPQLAGKYSSLGRVPSPSRIDPILEQELTVRLMLREVAPWIASLDRDPVPLKAPSALLRTQGTAGDDSAWFRRCPHMEIREVPGHHHSLFDPENLPAIKDAFITATSQWG